jgi:hypothetical protein
MTNTVPESQVFFKRRKCNMQTQIPVLIHAKHYEHSCSSEFQFLNYHLVDASSQIPLHVD